MATSPSDSELSPRPPSTRRGAIPLAAIGVLAVAALVRGAINFANVTPGGIDAGYYPIQARALIESGSLLYRDVPLYHHAVATLARALIALGWSVDAGTLAASKAVDTTVPLALGAVVLAMAWQFVRAPIGRRRAGGAPRWASLALAAPVALAVLSAPAIRMVSDFQKQAAAMALLAASVWACQRALSNRSILAWAAVAALLGLTGLTHAGTFAAAGLTLACIGAVHAIVFARLSPSKLVALAGLATAAGAALFAGVYFADQGKALGIVRGLSRLTRLSAFDETALPGGFDPLGLAVALAAHVIGVWTFVVARRAHAAPASDRSVALGCAIAAMALSSPLLSHEYFMRLTLMAPAPLSIALAFVLAQRARDGRSAWPAAAALVMSAASATAPIAMLMRPMVNDDGIAELASVRAIVAQRPGTAVVARHGLEFWAAYFLHVPVRTAPARSADLSRFDRVLLLDEIDGPMRRGPRAPGGPMSGPRQRRAPMPDLEPPGQPQRVGPPVFRGTVFTLSQRLPDSAGR